MSEAGAVQLQPLDEFWQGVCDFIAWRGVDVRRTMAPREFGNHLPGALHYQNAATVDWNGLDCIVFHKGWVGQLPGAFLREAVRRFIPVFASEVFVVYGRDFVEPLKKGRHIQAFLEQIPAEDAAPAAPPAPPLMVYAGNGRMICRDVENHKVILLSAASSLVGAFAAGRNLVGELREAIRPAVTGARKIIDYGAGLGIFAIAAKEAMAEDGIFLAVETAQEANGCLVANIDLMGMFWRTEFVSARPARLRDLSDANFVRHREFLSVDGRDRIDLTLPCDALHIDLDFGLGELVEELPAFAGDNGCPAVILSRGLGGGRLDAAADESRLIAEKLRPLDYDRLADSPSGPRSQPGAIEIYVSGRRGR